MLLQCHLQTDGHQIYLQFLLNRPFLLHRVKRVWRVHQHASYTISATLLDEVLKDNLYLKKHLIMCFRGDFISCMSLVDTTCAFSSEPGQGVEVFLRAVLHYKVSLRNCSSSKALLVTHTHTHTHTHTYIHTHRHTHIGYPLDNTLHLCSPQCALIFPPCKNWHIG